MDELMDVFLIKNDDVLEKHNTTQDKVGADVEKEFDSKPIYNKFFFENQNKVLWWILAIKKFLRWTIIILVQRNQVGFCSEER